MDLLYDKKIALIYCIIAITFSVFVLGGTSLKKEAKKVSDIFYGNNEYNINVESECLNIISQASNTVIIARRYIEGSNALVNEVEFLTKKAAAEAGNANLVNTTSEISGPLKELFLELWEYDLSKKDKDYVITIETNMETSYKKIGLSGYNAAALSFNAEKSSFYTNMVARIRRIGNMPVFNF